MNAVIKMKVDPSESLYRRWLEIQRTWITSNYTNSQKTINAKITKSGVDTFTAKETVFAGLADWYEKNVMLLLKKVKN